MKTIKLIKTKMIILLLLPSITLLAANPEISSQKAVKAAENKQFNEAQNLFNDSLTEYNQSSARTLHNMGLIFEKQKKYKKGILYFGEAIKRNPNQNETYSHLANCHYKNRDYFNAIKYGEEALSRRTNEAEISKWLPTAYERYANEKKKTIGKKKFTTKNKEALSVIKQKKDLSPDWVTATLETSVRSGYNKNNQAFDFLPTPGLIMPLPWYVTVNSQLFDLVNINFEIGNPLLAGNLAPILAQTEIIELSYIFLNIQLGLGCAFNHYHNDWAFGQTKKLLDWEIGFLLQSQTAKYLLKLKLYPRILPKSSALKPGYDFDRIYLDVFYAYRFNKMFSLYTKFVDNGFYFFDNEKKTSDYTGNYDLAIGLQIDKKFNARYLKLLTFNIDLTERFYFEDKNNIHPYNAFNGQGLFGLNKYTFLDGAPISGFKGFAQVINFKVTEKLTKYIDLYQKMSLEITTKNLESHDLVFTFGLSSGY